MIGAEPGAATVGGNESRGIELYGSNHVVGGTAPGASNLIGSNGTGIAVAVACTGSACGPNPPTGNVVLGNDVVGNNATGVSVSGSNNRVGGLISGEGNRVNGNATGISVSGQQCLIFGNEVMSNTGTGISVSGSENQIGALAAGAGNHLDGNGKGIVVSGSSSKRNPILSNIVQNTSPGPAIDLGNDGPTSNDLGDGDTGPNELQNFPIVVISHISTSETSFTGELNSAPTSNFTVQVFGNLEGDAQQRLLQTQTVMTDANGVASFAVVYPGKVEASSVTATATDALGNTSEMSPSNGPVQLANISTRAVVGTGDKIMIAGFIIRTPSQKKVAVRALGPSLAVPSRLADPYLEIRGQNGAILAKNDDWVAGGQQQELADSGLTPSNNLESAIVISLPQGTYTAQVSGAHGETGTAIVELYDLGAWPADSGRLLNLSTRGQVLSGDDALIGGFIVRGDAQGRVIIRAIGPDLTALGVPEALQDPTLELRDRNGTLLASNDDWRSGTQEQEIENTQLAPNDDRDSAIVTPLFPGGFTAIVRGKNGETGLALVEFYDLKQ